MDYIPASVYQVLQQMFKFRLSLTKNDTQLGSFGISLFLNALRGMPQITIGHISKVMDVIQTALTVKKLQHDQFWGGMDLHYMHEIQGSNPELFEKLQYHQFTSWEQQVLEACQQYSVTLETENEEDSDDFMKNVMLKTEAEEAEEQRKDAEKPKKEKPKLEILKAQGKFKHALVMKDDMRNIDPTIFDLYVQLYKEYCQDMDPSLCNKMLQMHIEI